MYGIELNNMHTWLDYGLRCLSCKLGNPAPEYKYLKIPGADGQLDLTESVYGRITYGTRPLTAKFEKQCTRAEHMALRADLNKLFLGKACKIILDDNTNLYAYGRVTLNPDHQGIYGSFEIQANCDPYLYRVDLTSRTFNVSGSLSITLTNSQMPVSPTLYTDKADMQIEYKGKRYNIITGGVEIPEIVLTEGNNNIKLYGAGTVKIEYRQGEL